MNKKLTTKQGAASLYVVIFTTLLLGIITIGFVRIMLSESIQTSNTDLSQSAYDSALAGIEDAKLALLRYHDCISQGATAASGGECGPAIAAIQKDNSKADCDLVREMLGRKDGSNETMIQSSAGASGAGADMEQAYTCVLVDENSPNYLSQLNGSYHTKMIPLRPSPNQVGNIKQIRIEWYSDLNANNQAVNMQKPAAKTETTNKPANSDTNTGLFPALPNSNAYYAPPTLGVQLFQTATTFNLSQLNTNSGAQTDRGTLLLYPSSATNLTNTIGTGANIGFPASSDKAANTPIPVRCNGSGYRCSVTIQIPDPIGGARSDASAFLRVFLPYGSPETDFSVTLLDGNGGILPFLGVQASIDATGRANDLFRRIESRVELVDIYYPFPEYSALLPEATANSGNIDKNFFVTRDASGALRSGQI